MSDLLDRTDRPGTAAGDAPASPDQPLRITRRRLDLILTGLGAVAMIVLIVAGGLLTWGSSFAEDYVSDELAAQNISFPDAEALTAQGRDDLAGFGGEQVTTGEQAEAYASYIQGHIAEMAEGQTYADLGGPERAAEAAVNDAIANGAPAEEVAALEEEAAAITEQRESIFRGEMLRGALLNTFAWSTIGRIAGIAAIAAFVAAAAMALLVIAGAVHTRRHAHTTA